MDSTIAASTQKKPIAALMSVALLQEPLTCLFIWLPFILRKQCGATAFILSLLATIKPVVSLLSFYWSQFVMERGWSNRQIVGISGFLARVPFLFFPFIDSIPYDIFATAAYLFFSKASIPGWMETLKLNFDAASFKKWFSWSTTLGYVEGMFLAWGLGYLFDHSLLAWRYLFAISAVIGMIGVLGQTRFPLSLLIQPPLKDITLKTLFVKPIQDALEVLNLRKDFALFQKGFMYGGLGIMLVNVVLPLFLVDILDLKHLDYANCRYFLMGIGFILFSPLWQKWMEKRSIFRMTQWICLGFGAYVVLLYGAVFSSMCLYLAFFLYGVFQAGSHLIWHLSGPVFAKNEDSKIFSSVNLVMVGLRGVVGPLLGTLLYVHFGPWLPFALGLTCCLIGAFIMRKEQRLTSAYSLSVPQALQ